MKRAPKTILFAATFALIVLSGVSCDRRGRYEVISGYAQGGTYTVKYNSRGVVLKPGEVRRGIDSILVAIDTTLSGYNKGSVLSRFNAGEEVVLPQLFLDMYELSCRFYERTGGALDCAASPLFDAWGFGFKNDSLPDAGKVAALKEEIALRHSVPEPSPGLNFNSIAQGYSSDLVARYLYGIGVRDMLVDIGEIFCDGLNPNGVPWTCAIDRPVDGNNTPGADIAAVWQGNGGPCGIVTSGNYRKYYISDGRKYAHTVDPRSGYPVTHNLLSATVIAPDAVTADACATWFMVIGLDEAKAVVGSDPSLEACLIYDDGGVMKEWHSSGFNIISDATGSGK